MRIKCNGERGFRRPHYFNCPNITPQSIKLQKYCDKCFDRRRKRKQKLRYLLLKQERKDKKIDVKYRRNSYLYNKDYVSYLSKKEKIKRLIAKVSEYYERNFDKMHRIYIETRWEMLEERPKGESYDVKIKSFNTALMGNPDYMRLLRRETKLNLLSRRLRNY